jgi:hypothetical protein
MSNERNIEPILVVEGVLFLSRNIRNQEKVSIGNGTLNYSYTRTAKAKLHALLTVTAVLDS